MALICKSFIPAMKNIFRTVGTWQLAQIVCEFCQLHDPLTLQVTHAVPHPQGAPLHPTVEVVEEVAMTTMAAVPGMAMAVETVTPAVGASRTLLAVPSARPGKTSREATLLANTAAQAGAHLGGVELIEQIEEWTEVGTEMDSDGNLLGHIETTERLHF